MHDQTNGTFNDSDKVLNYNCSINYSDFYKVAQLITGLVLYPLICIIGISGSIFTLVVLNQWRIATSTSVFLSALAVADLIRLLNDALYFIFSVLVRTDPDAGNRIMGYMSPFSHYILNQSVCVASWLTVYGWVVKLLIWVAEWTSSFVTDVPLERVWEAVHAGVI